jgi:tetratricopeptide (TPR) repeat protein
MLRLAGRTEEAIALYQKGFQLAPIGPFGPWDIYYYFGVTLRNAGRFEAAAAAYKKAIQLGPDEFLPHLGLAITYIIMGRDKEARAEAAEVLRINPNSSVDSWAKTFEYKDQSQKDKTVNAARKAGLK